MKDKNRPISKMAQIMFQKQISSLELGNKVGISHSSISLIKNGWRKPSPDLVAKIEAELGASHLFE